MNFSSTENYISSRHAGICESNKSQLNFFYRKYAVRKHAVVRTINQITIILRFEMGTHRIRGMISSLSSLNILQVPLFGTASSKL